jgi:hypothetical protein
MNKWILFILLMLSAICRGQQTDERALQEIFFDENAEFSATKPLCEFIPLETGKDNLLGKIDHAEIVNGRIFVSDNAYSKSIQAYNMQGKYIDHIGAVGQGPGEYINPNFFRINKATKTIWVNGGSATKLLIYDLNTFKYLFSKGTDRFVSWISLPNGDHAWWRPLGYEKNNKKYSILITDSMMRPKNYFHSWEYHISGEVLYTMEKFYGLKNKVFYYEAHDPIVYEITSGGERATYKFKFGSYPFPSPDYMKKLTSGRKLMNTGYVVCYMFLETEQFILAKYLAGNGMHFGVYDKKKKKAYRYADFHENDALFSTVSLVGVTDDDRFILSLPAENLWKRRNTQRADLRAITKNVKEDDNPVLCILTLK